MYTELLLSNYATFTRWHILWELPLSTGIRLQNAYKSRNTEDDEGPPVDAYARHTEGVLQRLMPQSWLDDRAEEKIIAAAELKLEQDRG